MQITQRTLRRGSTGEDVETLQATLNSLGFGPIAEDGEFGSNTEAAVKRYQISRRLSADGILGPKTLDKMLSEIN
jgi:peptidoglycan hydrolase-like protein with peptidoglycan-binding domain